ncbi:MAG: iron chelate uptake ABC transporter family permease subunit [Thermaurantimonas sp.]
MEPNFLWVIAGCVLLSLASARVGLYYFLQKKSLSGDVISHALLPGVVFGYLLAGEKSVLALLAGAFVSGLISVLVMEQIQHSTFIKSDASMAIVLSTFYGLGIVLLTYTYRLPFGNQAGLDTFLFGKAASLTLDDVTVYTFLAIAILVLVQVFERPFLIMSFDPSFADSIGLKVHLLRQLLTFLIISAVVLGVQAVGVVLMSAFIILPSMIGRLLSPDIRAIRILSLAAGVIMAICGSFISYHQAKMPTGPVMVLAGGSMVLLILVWRAVSGNVFKTIQRLKYRQKIKREDALKFLYKTLVEGSIGVKSDDKSQGNFRKSSSEIISSNQKKTIRKLVKDGYAEVHDGIVSLTDKGKTEAERIVRLHRLWEVYQATRLRKHKDLLHNSADVMEHFIPPHLEKMLIAELNKPAKDPHDKDIPYD